MGVTLPMCSTQLVLTTVSFLVDASAVRFATPSLLGMVAVPAVMMEIRYA